MNVRNSVFVLMVALLALPSHVWAGRNRTLSMEPDPSCRRSKLVVPVEQVLRKSLKAPGLKVLGKSDGKGRLLLQFFLMEHPAEDGVQVQLDGQIYDQRNGKLLAEGNARSQSFEADEGGRQQAAEQAAQDLTQQLNEQLETAFASSGRGRRIMLQVELAQEIQAERDKLLRTLQVGLKAFGPEQRGSTDRNLVITLYSSERSKNLAERIDKLLSKLEGCRASWIVKSRSTLMLRVER